jgi:hypothetical protein
MIKLTPEQRARADELLRSNPPPFKVKPKPKLQLRVNEQDLSPRIVEAVRKSPESVEVRVTAKDEELTVVDRPRRTELIEVVETKEGKVSVARRYDCVTGVNGTLNLTRACRYRHGEPDPSASSPCPARENNVVRCFPLCPSLCWVAP